MPEQWVVGFVEEFEAEFEELPQAVQDELLARAKLLEHFGPQLGESKASFASRTSPHNCAFDSPSYERPEEGFPLARSSVNANHRRVSAR